MNKTDTGALLAQLKEAEELLCFPGVSGHLERATKLLTSIARAAPSGPVARLAMRALSEAHALRPSDLPLRPDHGNLTRLLRELRSAIQAQSGSERQ